MHVSQRRVSNRSRPRVEVVGQLTGSELRGGSESSGEDVQHMYVSPGEPSTRRAQTRQVRRGSSGHLRGSEFARGRCNGKGYTHQTNLHG